MNNRLTKNNSKNSLRNAKNINTDFPIIYYMIKNKYLIEVKD